MECCGKDCKIKSANNSFKKVVFGVAIFGFLMALASEFELFYLPKLMQILLFVASYFMLGYGILKAAFLGLLRREYFNENSLMVLASLGAFCIGDGAEAVAILLFYRVGEFLENLIVEKSKKQIRSLADLKVENARILQEGSHVQIPPERVKKDDVLIVFAGERILADGVVIKGEGSVDNSALSGESIPQSVCVGDKVLSGGINLDGILEIRATQSYVDSAFSKVLELIEEGSAQKSKSEEFITRFAYYYTPIVTLCAFLVALIPSLYFWALGGSFMQELQTWAYRGIIFLVVSCPCALVISIPLTFFASLGRASKEGILIKGSSYLEALNSVGAVVFDKTGTLTKGILSLKEVRTYGDYAQDFALSLAVALESHSNHPIAKAILEARETLKNVEVVVLDSIKECAGGGILAQYKGEVLALGNARFIKETIGQQIAESQSEKCEIFLSLGTEVVASFVLEDGIKEGAKDAVRDLGGLDMYILSGDRAEVTQNVAQQVGITNYFAPLLPADKVGHLKEILAKNKALGKKVIFVGDGINDAPSLALSDIGIAMGNGSDVALEGADIVIMRNDLKKIPFVLKLAQKTRLILWQNIIFALGVKVAIMLFGVFGIANLWIALFGDVGVAALALLNAMRAIR
ncbi:heavy metal translocating P-type ATPase [Helicobacter turcicus]|uniref:P-type Zn(2+) transporter n=1 Tax=Helicobacter turcicus TaxID=2867412 RepID=A0ABS7JP28_9HELI|nr:heavy metal translocating P-type ATPase [Helicobacter turcicus]MBX7491163.1 cadmium-translocating P-type ATPase [Helicobacter turcicus]MBX7546030.1 cadmium-translocating P-type ATPase [Helicobacter turcicus]